jgi:predicted dehydrogenase
MTSDTIRVGILGTSPDWSWAARAYIPALRALPQYEITAIGTSREMSARGVARRFGVAHAFTDARELARHPNVDLVAITVKVPRQVDLIHTALRAGKHVYCEWPLALTSEQGQALVTAARNAGVHDAVGLQARYTPAVSHARELVVDGYVGRITAATVYTTGRKKTPYDGLAELPPAKQLCYIGYPIVITQSAAERSHDHEERASLLRVTDGHTLDALEYLLGGITELSAARPARPTRPTHRTTATTDTTGATGTSDAPGAIGRTTESITEPIIEPTTEPARLNATLADGTVATVRIRESAATEPRTRIEISGTEGDLAIAAHGPCSRDVIKVGDLRLRGRRTGEAWQDLPISDHQHWISGDAPSVEARSVGRLYARLAEDIRSRTRNTPSFETGMRLHRMLEAMRRSATTGVRQLLL